MNHFQRSLLTGGTLLCSLSALAQHTDKPNILFILCDDMGYGDLACYGQPYISTPNIDRMASEGMRFTQAYAGSPVSAPSRATLMTGQHTGHTHVRGNKEYWTGRPKVQYGASSDPDRVGQEPYDTAHVILPEIMKANGYTTGMFGKWAGGYEGSVSTPKTRGIDEYYGYICDGIYQTQEEVENSARLNGSVTVGDLKYRDISGPDGVPDGKISAEYDRVPLGNSLPRFQYGGRFNCSWKGIDFSLVFQGIGKQNSYLSAAYVQPLRDNYGNIPSSIEGKYWSVFNTAEENAAAQFPRLSKVSKDNNYATSSFWIFNGSYFRLKNITLGYTLPEKWTSKVKMNTLRFYVSANDLFCLSNYPKGWDPEMGTSAYPITTSVLLGLSVKF